MKAGRIVESIPYTVKYVVAHESWQYCQDVSLIFVLKKLGQGDNML
jgi:hypothetical protein